MGMLVPYCVLLFFVSVIEFSAEEEISVFIHQHDIER